MDNNDDLNGQRGGDDFMDQPDSTDRGLDQGLPNVLDPSSEFDDEQLPAEKRKLMPLLIAGGVGVILLVVVGMLLLNSFSPKKSADVQAMPFGTPPAQQMAGDSQPAVQASPYPNPQIPSSQESIPAVQQPVNQSQTGMVEIRPDVTVPSIKVAQEPASISGSPETQAQLDALTQRVTELESKLETVSKRGGSIQQVASSPSRPKPSQKAAPEPKPQKSVSAGDEVLAGYSLQAIVPGQAWITKGDNVTVIHVGDVLPGVGTVKSINPDSHSVVTSAGTIR